MQTVKLNNGIDMPIIGYGVFQVTPEECERCVLDAISVGYRLIDTAQAYFNEEAVGRAIVKSGVKREEIFLTTKVWIYNNEEDAARSIDESLRKLQTDYIDLLLIHQPLGDYHGTWRAMEKALKAGKVRAIGLSNFTADRYVDMVEFASIAPAVNQLKTNVFSQQMVAESEMSRLGTRIMASGPLTQNDPDLLTNPVLKALSAKYQKTPHQIALRYLIERGIIAIPKTTNIDRMKQNLDVFDFSITSEEMQEIAKIDKGQNFRSEQKSLEHVRFLLNYVNNFAPNN